MLCKLTLNAQLALLAKNALSLDESIKDKMKTLHDTTVELERLRGARQYSDALYQQVQQAIEAVTREEKLVEAPPPVTT